MLNISKNTHEPRAWIERRYVGDELVHETCNTQPMPESYRKELEKHYRLEIIELAPVGKPYVSNASTTSVDDRQAMSHEEMVGLCTNNPALASGLPLEDKNGAEDVISIQDKAQPVIEQKLKVRDRYFTAVFRVPDDWRPEAAIFEHPYWTAGSWSHALDDRDAAIRRAEIAEAELTPDRTSSQ